MGPFEMGIDCNISVDVMTVELVGFPKAHLGLKAG